MKTPTQEEIRAKAESKYPLEMKHYQLGYDKHAHEIGLKRTAYQEALTDMQQTVDIEALKNEFKRLVVSNTEIFSNVVTTEGIVTTSVNVDNLLDWLVINLQPSPQSDAVEFAKWTHRKGVDYY